MCIIISKVCMKAICILVAASLVMTTAGDGAIDHEVFDHDQSTGAIRINSLHTIAFGSCYNTLHGGGIWRLIDSFDPDHLVLLGDNIYADKIVGHFDDNTPMVIEEEYRYLSQMPEFQTLLDHVSDWSLTYDDHDYGVNNADKTFPHRNISQLLFWDFAQSSFKDSSVDPRSRSGVYSSKTIRIPPATTTTTTATTTAVGERRDFVYKTVLLDSRSNKDQKGTSHGDFLGGEQWDWLTGELLYPEADGRYPDLVLLGSSILVLSDEKLVEETWDEFPDARRRLLKLIGLASLHTTIVLLSGDIHRSEISTATNRLVLLSSSLHQHPALSSLHLDDSMLRALETALSTPVQLVEFTSSGLSHTFTKTVSAIVSRDGSSPNSSDHPSGRTSSDMDMDKGNSSLVVEVEDRGWLCTAIDYFYQLSYPAYYREDKYRDAYANIHFGLLDIINTNTIINSSVGEYSLLYRTIAHDGKVVNTKSLPLRPVRSLVDMQGCNDDSSSSSSCSSENSRSQYIQLLEQLLSDDSVRVETTPFWGPKTWIGMIAYRAKISFFLLCFVVLPISYMLWLVGASVWYILRGAELARRTKLEVQYQEHSRTMDSYGKKHV